MTGIAHPREYDDTPEGRICAEAREIMLWFYEQQKKRDEQHGDRGKDYPPAPDFRDFFDELGPLIRVEMLDAQIKASEFANLHLAMLQSKLESARFELAQTRARRS